VSKIPVHQLPIARQIIRFARVSVFHVSKHTFPIQWGCKEHEEQAFTLHNEYSGMWAPDVGNEEGAHEHVFNWLLEEVLIDLVPAQSSNGDANIAIQISDN